MRDTYSKLYFYMTNPQLLDYVHQQQAMGNSKEVIQKSLAASGWSQPDIDEAFATVATKVTQKRSVIGQILHGIWRAIEILVVLVILGGFVIGGYVFNKVHNDVSSGQGSPSENGFLTSINATIVQAGLEIYKQQNNSYPATLDVLAPKYIASVPNDPTTNQPFSYQVAQGGMDYKLCSTMNGQPTCATASTTLDGTPNKYSNH